MIDVLARYAGIAPSYVDFFGKEHEVSVETKRSILRSMGFDVPDNRAAANILRELTAEQQSRSREPVYVVRAGERVDLPCMNGVLDAGYFNYRDSGAATRVIAAPAQAYVPASVDRTPAWGLALQLYSLRSERNWGIGDFGDLARFSEVADSAGAQCIALNPLHQLHLIDPASASPYSPLSRLHLNALYIDVDAAARSLRLPATRPDLAGLQSSRFVDYPAVAHAKLTALRALHDGFTCLEHEDGRIKDFRRFCRRSGAALRSMAIYEALSAFFKRADAGSHGWMQWPAAYRDPKSDAVLEYAAMHPAEIEFFEFLQWLADSQLASASDAAKSMALGLYRDLAIGVDANSVDVWSDREVFCEGICVGAPPDELNTDGQNWGLPPFNPRKLRERAYQPFIDVVRANMRHAGVLRIDHVMGLKRLFWIPQNAPASEGAYVDFPFEDLLGVLTLESHRNRCMIVGEDLGTVPPGFRERMAAARIFSCRLLYFERKADGTFQDPADYPHDAVASTGTHDLPPLLAYWDELSPEDRLQLLRLLGGFSLGVSDLDLAAATYRTLGRADSAVVLLQMEDALLQRERVNVPGTTNEAPNWKRRLPIMLEALQNDERFATITGALRKSRSRRGDRP